jgi:hypothetical protein
MKAEIKANDLRVGNKLIRNGIVVTADHQTFYDVINNPEQYEAIELTEELLLNKCNFKHYGIVQENQYEFYNRFVLENSDDSYPNYEVHIIESCYGGQYFKEIVFSLDIDERQRVFETAYLHNLQNHFKIAMGEELTINF